MATAAVPRRRPARSAGDREARWFDGAALPPPRPLDPHHQALVGVAAGRVGAPLARGGRRAAPRAGSGHDVRVRDRVRSQPRGDAVRGGARGRRAVRRDRRRWGGAQSGAAGGGVRGERAAARAASRVGLRRPGAARRRGGEWSAWGGARRGQPAQRGG
eukprot:1465256-Prymnesium_polylepis.1